jgi:hypothetical protein
VNGEPRLDDIALAVADGRAVDWDGVDLQKLSPADRELIEPLRLVERVVQAHTCPEEPHLPDGPDDPPTTWGPLTIVSRIGSGSYGDVYRAHDMRLDRPVALKLLRRRESGEGALAVIEEARLMARVSHPNVATVYGAERLDGRVGLWMEYCEGETLDQAVKRDGPMSAAVVAEIGLALCSALTAVHAAGLLHHDLKAQNVLRTTDGRIVLTDFGAGRQISAGTDRAPQLLRGTPAYLAPEVRRGDNTSVRSEIYSLGVLLGFLSTGSLPPHPQAERPAVLTAGGMPPPQLRPVIARCLAPDPQERFESMADVAWSLTQTARAWELGLRSGLGVILRAAVAVVLGTCIGAAVAATGSLFWPRQYRSEMKWAVTYARTLELDGSNVARTLSERLPTIRRASLQFERLAPLLTVLEPTETVRDPDSGVTQRMVDRLRDATAIEVAEPVSPRSPATLIVSFTGTSVEAAAYGALQIGKLVTSEIARDREDSAIGWISVLDEQLRELAPKLDRPAPEGDVAAVQFRRLVEMKEAARTTRALADTPFGEQIHQISGPSSGLPVSPRTVWVTTAGGCCGAAAALLLLLLPVSRRALGVSRAA